MSQVAAQLGVDDRDPRIAFLRRQEKSKVAALRIEIQTVANEPAALSVPF